MILLFFSNEIELQRVITSGVEVRRVKVYKYMLARHISMLIYGTKVDFLFLQIIKF